MHQLSDRVSAVVRARSGLVGALWLFVGCGPAVGKETGDSDERPSASSGVASESGASGVTSLSPPVSTSGPASSSTTEPSATRTDDGGDAADDWGGACGLKGIHSGTDFPCHLECDVFEQDCGRGQKCAPWANDGGMAWNATKCVPVDRMPDAVADSCIAQGNAFSGVDSCALGATCFNVDADTNAGQCYALCGGDLSAPSCDRGSACWVHSEQVLALCIPTCDPTVPDACALGQVCIPGDDAFLCVPSASPAALALEACTSIDACEAGLFCAALDTLEACESDAGCCTPYCNLDTPLCPGTTGCEPYFGQAGAPEGLEHVGVCVD